MWFGFYELYLLKIDKQKKKRLQFIEKLFNAIVHIKQTKSTIR